MGEKRKGRQVHVCVSVDTKVYLVKLKSSHNNNNDNDQSFDFLREPAIIKTVRKQKRYVQQV